MELKGIVHKGEIIVPHPEILPEGATVTVIVNEPVVAEPTLAFLLPLAGTVDDLPEDMARNHDHHIHGAPKR